MSSKQPPPYESYESHEQGPPPAYTNTAQHSVVVAAPRMQYGECPVPMTCPFCHAQIVTATEYKAGLLTWIAIGTICIVGAAFLGLTWFGCCLIPCCINACKDVTHTCPNCERPVGTFSRLENM